MTRKKRGQKITHFGTWKYHTTRNNIIVKIFCDKRSNNHRMTITKNNSIAVRFKIKLYRKILFTNILAIYNFIIIFQIYYTTSTQILAWVIVSYSGIQTLYDEFWVLNSIGIYRSHRYSQMDETAWMDNLVTFRATFGIVTRTPSLCNFVLS